MRGWLVAALTALAVLSAGPAAAEWRRAESAHFVVYSDGSERDLREQVRKLETFDHLLRMRFNLLGDDVVTRKLPIYLLANRRALERVYPHAGEHVVGVYMPVGEDIFAVAIRREGEDVLFHEYVHHFMLANFASAYPGWFVEGFAEYYMTAEIGDGTVTVGEFNENRASWLGGMWIPLEDLLSKRPADVNRSSHQATYYPVAWLLTHWFLGNSERHEQLDRYMKAVVAGGDPVAEMQVATGLTPEQLRRALRAYANGRIPAQRITFPFPEIEMEVTPLPSSADDLLLLSQRLKVGTPQAMRATTVEEVRRLAARHPDDAFAQVTLAHAELHFGDRETGQTMLRDLTSRFPDNVEARQFMAVALMDQAEDADDSRRLLGQARVHLGEAYKIDGENFYTLYLLARSRQGAETYPNDNDLSTWEMAFERAPQWSPTRLGLASALIAVDRREEAVALLLPIANGPHAGGAGEAAQAMIELARSGAQAPEDAVVEAAATDEAPEPPPTAPTGDEDERAPEA